MKRIKVDEKFRLPFFSRFGKECFLDASDNYLYFSNDEVVNAFKLNFDDVEDLSKEPEITDFDDSVKEVKNEVKKQEETLKKLVTDLIVEFEYKQNEKIEEIKFELGKSLDEIRELAVDNETVQNLDRKIDALKSYGDNKNKDLNDLVGVNKTEIERIETNLKKLFKIILEKIDDSDDIPDLFANDVSVEYLWNNLKNKRDAAIFSIMVLIKKILEDKGARVI